MKKFLVHFILSLTTFFTVFFAFSRIDCMQIFNLYKNTTEQKLGTWFWKAYSSIAPLLENEAVLLSLDSILNHTCEANQIERSTTKLHMRKNTDVKL